MQMRYRVIGLGALSLVLAGCNASPKPTAAPPPLTPGPIHPVNTVTAHILPSSQATAMIPTAVDPLSPSLIYALAQTSSNAQVLRSQDGGQHWTRIGTVPGSSPKQLEFVNSEDGLAISPHTLWSTRNGGQSWTLQNRQGLEHVCFANAHVGFAITPNQHQVVGTIDGGHIWNVRLSSPDVSFSDVSAAGTSVVYALGGSSSGPRLYRSTNDGKSWTLLFANVSQSPLARAYKQYVKAMAFPTVNPLPQFKQGGQIDFTSPTTGWATLFSGNYLAQAVLRTTDGGAAWNYVWGNSGCAMGCNAMGGGLHPATFYGPADVWRFDLTRIDVSTNAGKSWQHSSPLPFSLAASQAVNDIAMISPTVGWLSTPAGIYATVDGGLHWAQQWPNIPMTASRISMRPSGAGWMVTQNLASTLWVTHNGGETWTALPHTFGVIASLDLWNHSRGMVVSLQGVSGITRDGGRQWIPLNWPRSMKSGLNQALGIQFVNSRDGWATNLSDQLLTTENGGRKWSPVHQFPPGPLAVDFLSTHDGWALTGVKSSRVSPSRWNVHVVMTHDGGKNWSSAGSIHLLENPMSLSFISMNQGWVATANSLLETTDGGRTWSAVSLPHVHPASIDALSAHSVYLVTLRGRLLKTQNGGKTWISLIP